MAIIDINSLEEITKEQIRENDTILVYQPDDTENPCKRLNINNLGGSVEKFIVTFTQGSTDTEFTADKTVEQIYEAYIAGQIIEGKIVIPMGDNTDLNLIVHLNSVVPNGSVSFSFVFANGGDGVIGLVSCDSGSNIWNLLQFLLTPES